MTQGWLPIVPRGKRDLKRAQGLCRREWNVWYKSKPETTVKVIACDNGDARRKALTFFTQIDQTTRFIDLRAKLL